MSDDILDVIRQAEAIASSGGFKSQGITRKEYRMLNPERGEKAIARHLDGLVDQGVLVRAKRPRIDGWGMSRPTPVYLAAGDEE